MIQIPVGADKLRLPITVAHHLAICCRNILKNVINLNVIYQLRIISTGCIIFRISTFLTFLYNRPTMKVSGHSFAERGINMFRKKSNEKVYTFCVNKI